MLDRIGRQITSGVITRSSPDGHALMWTFVPPVAPPLPRGLADPRPVVGIGTLAWFTAAVVLLVIRGPSVWMGACVIGGLLGLLGFAMIRAQRRAARRGARSAQRGVL